MNMFGRCATVVAVMGSAISGVNAETGGAAAAAGSQIQVTGRADLLGVGRAIGGDWGEVMAREQMLGELWGGRAWLNEKGISVEAALTVDYAKNTMGGVQTSGSALRSLFDLGVSVDLQKLAGLDGASAFLLVQSIQGDDGSAKLVGDAQAFSNIDYGEHRLQISELWYEQVVGERFAVKAGKMDVNGAFMFVENGGEFINSSAGFSPTIVGLPTYPETSYGGMVKMMATENNPFYAAAGLFDGSNAIGKRTGLHGPTSLGDELDNLFVIGEGGMQWGLSGDAAAGRIGVGAWRFMGDIERLDGGEDSGNTGLYLVFDQTVLAEGDDNTQGLNMFFQYGYADGHVAELDHHIGIGCAYTGLIPGRDQDVCGIMGSWVHFSEQAGTPADWETAVEVFYKLQVCGWASVKPDLQWIGNPGGEKGRDALVGTLRFEMSF